MQVVTYDAVERREHRFAFWRARWAAFQTLQMGLQTRQRAVNASAHCEGQAMDGLVNPGCQSLGALGLHPVVHTKPGPHRLMHVLRHSRNAVDGLCSKGCHRPNVRRPEVFGFWG